MYGYVGYIRKALEKGYSEHPGLHAVLTVCLVFSSFLDSACVAFCLFLSTGSHVHITIHATCCCIPRCTSETSGSEKSMLWRCKLGVGYGRMSPSTAKRPCTAGSQQPACTHKEHQILTTTEAASFASQFWDRKVHPATPPPPQGVALIFIPVGGGAPVLPGPPPSLPWTPSPPPPSALIHLRITVLGTFFRLGQFFPPAPSAHL